MSQSKKISEIAAVQTGLVLTRIGRGAVRGEEFPVINLRDIENGRVASLDKLSLSPLPSGAAADKSRVADGDVLVACRGTLLKAAVVDPETAGAYASSNLLIIRPGHEILPRVLVALLQSPQTQDELKSRSRSSGPAISLSAKDIADILVPIPPMDIQVKISSLLEAIEENYRASLDTAEFRRHLGYTMVSKILCEDFNENEKASGMPLRPATKE